MNVILLQYDFENIIKNSDKNVNDIDNDKNINNDEKNLFIIFDKYFKCVRRGTSKVLHPPKLLRSDLE